jgi:hypothetical protein
MTQQGVGSEEWGIIVCFVSRRLERLERLDRVGLLSHPGMLVCAGKWVPQA